MNAFLIHYRLLKDRLDRAFQTLEECDLSVEVVSCWDGDVINAKLIADSSAALWEARVKSIAPILLANALTASKQAESFTEALQLSNHWLSHNKHYPAWMKARKLKAGEVSVLLKHYYALGRIANGRNHFGLVAEDDILPRKYSKENLQEALKSAHEKNFDYIDIAGGAGLTCDFHPHTSQNFENILTMTPARTRTNACYIISKSYAKKIVETFLPLAFPIDWHMQYLFQALNPPRCGWAVEPVFTHGSETSVYNSWQA